MCLHRLSPLWPLMAKASPGDFYSLHLTLHLGFAAPASSLPGPLPLGLVPCGMPWPIREDLLSALFSLHDFIHSKYVEKKSKRKEEKHSTTQSTCFGQKINNNRGCILNVRLGITSLPLCAFGLYVAVFCQHEILSPLEDVRGGRAASPGFWRKLWFP